MLSGGSMGIQVLIAQRDTPSPDQDGCVAAKVPLKRSATMPILKKTITKPLSRSPSALSLASSVTLYSQSSNSSLFSDTQSVTSETRSRVSTSTASSSSYKSSRRTGPIYPRAEVPIFTTCTAPTAVRPLCTPIKPSDTQIQKVEA